MWFSAFVLRSPYSKFIYPSSLGTFFLFFKKIKKKKKLKQSTILSCILYYYQAIHGAEKGETAALLLSPGRTITSTADCANNGSQFTYFLTAPLQAFCQLVGFSSDIEAVSLF